MASTNAEHSPVSLVSQPRGVIKRDGSSASFDAEKIRSAVERAGRANGEFDASEAVLLTAQVIKVLTHKFHGEPPHI